MNLFKVKRDEGHGLVITNLGEACYFAGSANDPKVPAEELEKRLCKLEKGMSCFINGDVVYVRTPERPIISRSEVNPAKPRELSDTALADLSCLLDKLDSTSLQFYVLQFDDLIDALANETGVPVSDIKNRLREYRKNRGH